MCIYIYIYIYTHTYTQTLLVFCHSAPRPVGRAASSAPSTWRCTSAEKCRQTLPTGRQGAKGGWDKPAFQGRLLVHATSPPTPSLPHLSLPPSSYLSSSPSLTSLAPFFSQLRTSSGDFLCRSPAASGTRWLRSNANVSMQIVDILNKLCQDVENSVAARGSSSRTRR